MSTPGPFKFAKDPIPERRFLDWLHARPLYGILSESVRYLPYQARYAIFHALDELGVSPGHEVLLPSYVCAAAVEPIRFRGCTPVFYPVSTDCVTNVAEIEERITPQTRALVVVHYFGFADRNLLQLRHLCDRHNLVLIEDCAHVLFSEMQGIRLGSVGDAAVFSLRKFLPIPDGAALLLNGRECAAALELRKESLLSSIRHCAVLAEQRWPKLQPAGRSASRLARRLRGTSPSDDARPRRESELPSSETDFDERRVHSALSPVSAWILNHTRFRAVIEQRRQNYHQLSKRLSQVPGVQLLFPTLPAATCPWILPLSLEGEPFAHRKLREAGIPATAWDAVRPSGVKVGQFPQADFMYENLFFLPVHQSLTVMDLDEMASAVSWLSECRQRSRAVVEVG